MGVYDCIEVDGRYGQVKCWDCNLDTYHTGSKVPPGYGGMNGAYSIAMREGGFVNIENDVVVSWTDKPKFFYVIDKWGATFNADQSNGLLGENYFFQSTGQEEA